MKTGAVRDRFYAVPTYSNIITMYAYIFFFEFLRKPDSLNVWGGPHPPLTVKPPRTGSRGVRDRVFLNKIKTSFYVESYYYNRHHTTFSNHWDGRTREQSPTYILQQSTQTLSLHERARTSCSSGLLLWVHTILTQYIDNKYCTIRYIATCS